MLLKLGYKMLLKLVIVAVVSVVAVAYAKPLMEIVDTYSTPIDSPVDGVNVNFGFDPSFSNINKCKVSFDKPLDANSLVLCRLLDGNGDVVSEGSITLDNNLPQGSRLSLPVSADLQEAHGVKVLVIGKPAELAGTAGDDPRIVVNFQFDPTNKLVTGCLIKVDRELEAGTQVRCDLTDAAGTVIATDTTTIGALTEELFEIEVLVTPQDIQKVHDFRVVITPPSP